MRLLFLSVTILGMMFGSVSKADETGKPILMLGGSYANGKAPFSEGLQSPLFGIAVANGSFLDLGDALIREEKFVINEAEAGATSFERLGCGPTSCGTAFWESYDTQFDRALLRVTDFVNPSLPINADYVVINISNDCLHPGAFSVPFNETTPCSTIELNAIVDRMLALGQRALDNNLTPSFTSYPAYRDLDFPLFQTQFGFSWVISEADYNFLSDSLKFRITSELPDALFLEIWEEFEHIGDGIHPDTDSVEDAAEIILDAIDDDDDDD